MCVKYIYMIFLFYYYYYNIFINLYVYIYIFSLFFTVHITHGIQIAQILNLMMLKVEDLHLVNR